MSWLFSRALVLEYSAATSWGGVPSAPLNVVPTPHKFSRNGKTMEFSDLSRFGLTCAALTVDRGADLLTWYRADSRVRTFQLLEPVEASTASAAAYGAKCTALLARFDHATCSLKTAQLSLLGDSTECSVILPRWGFMRSGEFYPRPTWAPRIGGNESGLWPTPTVTGNNNAPKPGTKRGTGLATAARTWGTPTASIGRKGGGRHQGRSGKADTLASQVAEAEGLKVSQTGQLNPEWVEWLMGCPIGWTDLKPLETGRFLEWQRQHSPRSDVGKDAA